MAYYTDLKSHNTELHDKESISNAIKNILLTKKGSVPGKPDFGTDLNDILFEFIDHITVEYLNTTIKDVLFRYEPRIKVDSINIETQPEYNRIIVEIKYYYTFIKNFEVQSTKIVINK